MTKLFDAIASACAEVTKAIKTYIDTVALVEKDPTVPKWAKAESKPKYSMGEIEGLTEYLLDMLDRVNVKTPRMDLSSGEEVNTGHIWLDGNPIYAKAFSGDMLQVDAHYDATLYLPEGADKWLGASGRIGEQLLSNWRGSGEYIYMTQTADVTGNIILQVQTTWPSGHNNYDILVYYTKEAGINI